MTMGLGTALFESVDFNEGQVTNANLSDYNVPTARDAAALTHELVEREGAPIHGLGETALPPVPAAIGNAFASLGIELYDLPMTPERVLERSTAARPPRRRPTWRHGGDEGSVRPRRRARRAGGRRGPDARRRSARRRSPQRARDLRDRRLRRVHRHRRRRAGVRMPDARRAGRRAQRDHRRGAVRRRSRAAGVHPGARGAVRWCTPGMVLTVKAMLADDPHIDRERAAEGLGGNLCRCGSTAGSSTRWRWPPS